MKTLVKNGVSLIAIEDNTPITHGIFIEVGNPVFLRFDNHDNSISIISDVTLPPDYKPKKFLFDGKTWTKWQDWKNPNITAAKR